MINWEELFKRKNTTFHCETEEIAKQFLRIAHEHGYRWCSNKTYINKNPWNVYQNETCYNINEGAYCSKNWSITEGFNIINVKDLLGQRKPFKLKRK